MFPFIRRNYGFPASCFYNNLVCPICTCYTSLIPVLFFLCRCWLQLRLLCYMLNKISISFYARPVVHVMIRVCVAEYQKLFQSPVTRQKSGVSTNRQSPLRGLIIVPNCAVILLHLTRPIFFNARLQTLCLLACTCLSTANSRWSTLLFTLLRRRYTAYKWLKQSINKHVHGLPADQIHVSSFSSSIRYSIVL